MAVGNFLRDYRKRNQLGLTQLANIIEYDPSNLNRLLHGKIRNVKDNQVYRFAKKLGVTVEEIMEYEGEPASK